MQDYQLLHHEFPPVYDSNSNVLILGSFPSVKSREQQFYYGHPQNRFWKVLVAVVGNDPETSGVDVLQPAVGGAGVDVPQPVEGKSGVVASPADGGVVVSMPADGRVDVLQPSAGESGVVVSQPAEGESGVDVSQPVEGGSGNAVLQTVEEKKEFLLRRRIALWDVIEECEIIGSSDSSIRNVVPVDINVILRQAPIRKIFANGAKAYELYQKYLLPVTGIPCEKLPSTSPANAAYSLERLVECWRKILE